MTDKIDTSPEAVERLLDRMGEWWDYDHGHIINDAASALRALSAERDRLAADNAALREALEFYAPRTIDGITITGNDDAGIRARAALAASQPRKTDTKGV